MQTDDALGKAMLDYQRNGLRGEFFYRDGATTWEGDVWKSHFKPPDKWPEYKLSALQTLVDAGGSVLDVGCGGGMYALWLQDQGRDVVGVDISPNAIRTAEERGLKETIVADMFDLDLDNGAFRSALCTGTQIGSIGSIDGIREFLSDVARFTDEDGVLVLDSNNPTDVEMDGQLGYRADPRDGFAGRNFHEEYHRETASGVDRIVGKSHHVLVFSPARLYDIVVGTPWSVSQVYEDGIYFWAELEKV